MVLTKNYMAVLTSYDPSRKGRKFIKQNINIKSRIYRISR